MTRLFVDCEFNGFGGDLLSMALVSEDGAEWYEVLPEPSLWNEWVFENVFPVLNKEPVRSHAHFRASMREFLSGFENPTICADWYTDLMHFFACFAGRDHGDSFAFPCKTELRLINDYKSAIPHNALSDARAIKAAWNSGYAR